jgi:hypothetical protein
MEKHYPTSCGRILLINERIYILERSCVCGKFWLAGVMKIKK